MKKISLKLTIVAITMIFITSCSKAPNKILPKKDGRWGITETTTHISTGVATTVTGDFYFLDNGTGTLDVNSNTGTFTWEYDKSGKKITLNFSGNVYTYDVTEAKAKSEKWTQSLTTIAGVSYTPAATDLDVKLVLEAKK